MSTKISRLKMSQASAKTAQLLVANVTPPPALVDERVGRHTTINEIVNKGKFLTGEEINADQAEPKGNQPIASDWKHRGRIFSVTYDGKDLYPAYQFDMNKQPLPAIREVLLILKESDPWAIASWFHFPNSWITGPVGDSKKNKYVAIAPKDALKNRWQDVIKAAEKERGIYFA